MERGNIAVPPLVPLSFQVMIVGVCALKELCALDTMKLAESWAVFIRDERLQLFKLSRIAEVRMDLVNVPVCREVDVSLRS